MEDEAAGAQGPGQGVRRTGRHEVGPSGDHPGLGAAQKLVARERDQIGSRLEGLACGGLSDQPGGWPLGQPRAGGVEQPGADVGDHRGTQVRQFGHADRLGEALDPVVGAVDVEDQRCVVAGGCDGSREVPATGAVGGADLDQVRPGLRHHVGDPEPAAALDQLAARDDRSAPLGECGQGQQHRRGTVIDHDRRLGTAGPCQ